MLATCGYPPTIHYDDVLYTMLRCHSKSIWSLIMSTFFYYRIHVVIVVFAVSILSVVIPSVSLAQCDSTFQDIEEAGYVEAPVLADGTIDTLNVRPLDADGPDYVFYTASDSSKLRF